MTSPDVPDVPGIDELSWQRIADLMQRSERGRLLPPDLDDRRWQDLVDEALTLRERYAPQWTDRNPSDIGLTLIELFAWLVESLIYRLNRVPEKNYIAFLNLLGITRAPAVPARTLLTFTASTTTGLPSGTAAQTPGSETDAPIVFETDAPLTVVPASPVGRFRVETHPRTPAADEHREGPRADSVPVRLEPGEGVQVCIAIDAEKPPLDAVDLYVEPFRPPTDRQAVERVEWLYSVSTPPDPGPAGRPPWNRVSWGPWNRLDVFDDGTAGLIRPGVVRLRVPRATPWTAQNPRDEDAAKRWSPPPGTEDLPAAARLWLGLRITNDSPPAAVVEPPPDPPPAPQPLLQLRLDRLVLNTTLASSVGTVADELLGAGTGRPRQVLRLGRWPVHARPGTDTPYDHVQVTVAGAPWRAVDYLPDGPGQCHLLDPVSGEIAFGDHDPVSGRGRGTVPPKDAGIRAAYRYVSAGAGANVPAGLVGVLTTTPAGITTVTNPVRAMGGADEEPIEETKRRAPDVLRHRDRAVTIDDYELLARGAAPGIASVRCLPPRLQTDDGPVLDGERRWLKGDPWTYARMQRAPGVVNIVVVPDLGPDVAEPEPSLALVQDVIRVLDRRRAAATALHVTGPRYVRIMVRAEVEVFTTAIDEGRAVLEDVQAERGRAIREFLHPVHGGRDGRGWQVGESVYTTDLYRAIQPPADIGYVTVLDLAPEELVYGVEGEDDEHQRPIKAVLGEAGLANQVRLADYELVSCGTVTVTARKER